MRALFHALTFILAVAAVFAATTALAGEGSCAHCGSAPSCRKVCRLVCEEKKVQVVCWGCECEEFCMPGPSKPGCKHCETVCENCDAKVGSKSKLFVWFDWIPSRAEVFTKKKLMKKTVTVKVPSHRWVTEDVCAACAANCGSEVLPAPVSGK